MRYNDQTQGIQTPTCLIQAFHYLLTVALNGGQFVVTNVRVHCTQSFQTRQLGRQFFVGFVTRCINQCTGRFLDLRFTQLKDSVNILLHGVNQFAAGVTVNRVKLAVKGFKLHLGRQVVAVFIQQHPV